jgi:hypothetical protein
MPRLSVLRAGYASGCRTAFWGALLGLAAISIAPEAGAWVYPEHRDIAGRAVAELDPERRALLEKLWAEARRGHETRLCQNVYEAAQSERPTCIDYPAWSAIGGDHSCSSAAMVSTILDSPWILDVAEVTAQLRRRLATSTNRDMITNALRDSDIDLQRADPEYATRAGSNSVHFLLARPGVGTTLATYITLAFSEGVDINALATYAWYHIDALEKARALGDEGRSPEERAALVRGFLADEAFALHFLEDVFAAGHVAGTWGDDSLRKGTHDFYNENGLAVTTWRGERAVLTGDAWMRPEDAERAAKVIKRSLEQVLDVAQGSEPASEVILRARPEPGPGTLDVCRTNSVPKREHSVIRLLHEVLIDTPVPMLSSGLGAMPRFRTELGPFIGVEVAARGASLSGGFAQGQDNAGANFALELGLRTGFGLEGVMNEAGDGLIFLDAGVRLDSSSSNQLGASDPTFEPDTSTSVVPSRLGFNFRVRLPFWMLPGDLLLAGPILLLASPKTLATMAVVAGNGGIVPWQAGIATPIGRFQFVLGREVAVVLFGYGAEDRVLVPAAGGANGETTMIGMSSIQLEFPLLEYRPFRFFSMDQSSSLSLQLFGAVDLPTRSHVLAPEAAQDPELQPLWQIGARLSFDWRHYL